MDKEIAKERHKEKVKQYISEHIIERNVPYYVMLICLHGKKDVIEALFKYLDIKYKDDDTHYKSPNHLLCEYVLGCINDDNKTGLMSKNHTNSVRNLLGLFHLIYTSLYHFEQQYTDEDSYIKFLSNIIINCIKNGYCYAWYYKTIKKYSVYCGREPIKLLDTYHVIETDDDFIKLKGFDESISIKKFIKKPSRKVKEEQTNENNQPNDEKQVNDEKQTNDKQRNNDYQRYSVFYNFVHSITSDKDGKYCPYCNQFGRKEKSKKTGKDAVLKGCTKCSQIFNKVNIYFKAKGSSRRFLDSLRKDIIGEVKTKQEFYAKRLDALDKHFKKELIKNGYVKKKNWQEITEEDLKLIPEKVLEIKKEFEKRFTFEG